MEAQFKLAKRLEIIALQIEKETTFVDIGSDHAYLPCRVCLQDPSIRAIAGEVQQGPYENAIRTVNQFGLNDRISVRLGDGLEVMHPEDRIDTITIAGMGGRLITEILGEAPAKLQSVNTVIIQPNTNTKLVRAYLYETTGFNLYDEFIIEENAIIYEVLVAKKESRDPYARDSIARTKQFYFGPFLKKDKGAVFLKKWQQEYKYLEHTLVQMQQAKRIDLDKMKDLETKMTWIREEDI